MFVGPGAGGFHPRMFEPGQSRARCIAIATRAARIWIRRLLGCVVSAGVLLAAEPGPSPLVGVGATRDEVIDAYGWPTGQSKAGTREILTYPQGLVTLESGRVESVAFTMKPPWPAPRPRPGASPAPVPRNPEPVPVVTEHRLPEPAAVAPPPAAAAANAPEEPPKSTASAQSVELTSSLFTVKHAIVAALALGVAISVILLWLVWRNWASAARAAQQLEIRDRISDAASGLPSQISLATWPREKLAALVAAYVEVEGYHPELQPAGGDKDILIRRAAGARPQVVILCAEGEGGVVSVKRVREFFGTMSAAGAETGWFVAPAGFAAEARAFAEQHNLRLIDGAGLAAQLRDLPPLLLAKVMAQARG